MTEIVGAFLGCEEAKGAADQVPKGFDGSGLGLPQSFFEFGERHFNRIEIGAVGRQEEDARTGGVDAARCFFVFMARQVVENHCVAFSQYRHEDLLDISQEAFGIDRPVEHERCDQPVAGEASKKCRRQPMTVGCMAEGALADIGPGITARHRCRGPGLVEEDQPATKAFLLATPRFTALGDVGAILLAGA